MRLTPAEVSTKTRLGHVDVLWTFVVGIKSSLLNNAGAQTDIASFSSFYFQNVGIMNYSMRRAFA